MGLLVKHRYVCDQYYFKLSYLSNESSVYVCVCVCVYIHIYVYADICVYMYAFDSKTTVYYTHKFYLLLCDLDYVSCSRPTYLYFT